MTAAPLSQLGALVQRHALPDGAEAQLAALLEFLQRDDAPTSVRDPGAMVNVHVADSLSGLAVSALRHASLIADLGSGAGLPGLVLAVALPSARFVLVEANGKKAGFIRDAAATIGLANVDVVHARAEEWSDGVGRCDVVCARAVAALPVLCEYAAPLLRVGGVLVAWKGALEPSEEHDARAAAETLGLGAPETVAVTPYAGSAQRTLRVVPKIAPTPPRYPRRAGMATKRPLSAKSLR